MVHSEFLVSEIWLHQDCDWSLRSPGTWVIWEIYGEWRQQDGALGGFPLQSSSQKQQLATIHRQGTFVKISKLLGRLEVGVRGWDSRMTPRTNDCLTCQGKLPVPPAATVRRSRVWPGVHWLNWTHHLSCSETTGKAPLPPPEQPLSSHAAGAWSLDPGTRLKNSSCLPIAAVEAAGKQSHPHVHLPDLLHVHLLAGLICKPNPGSREPGKHSF